MRPRSPPETPPNYRHAPMHNASHDERDPIQTPTRAMGGKKAGGRGGSGCASRRGGQSDNPSPADPDRTNTQPEATGAEWWRGVELDDTGGMGRFIVFPLPQGFDAGRPCDAGSGR